MSRWAIDPPDDDAYDVRHDKTDCADCGRPAEAWLCETCSDQREAWAAATELRMAAIHVMQERPALVNNIPVIDVALVPIVQVGSTLDSTGVVDVALVPIQMGVNPQPAADARFLKRMARAILAADFSNIKDVA
jgi:hypothetical protein